MSPIDKIKSIKVGTIHYTVTYDENTGTDANGTCDFDNAIITVNKNLNKDVKEKVLVHEVTHALFDSLSYQHDEKKVDAFAQAFLLLVKENPDFITAIFDKTPEKSNILINKNLKKRRKK